LIQFFISANQGIKQLTSTDSPTKLEEDDDISKLV
jgi:hypothetical protein